MPKIYGTGKNITTYKRLAPQYVERTKNERKREAEAIAFVAATADLSTSAPFTIGGYETT